MNRRELLKIGALGASGLAAMSPWQIVLADQPEGGDGLPVPEPRVARFETLAFGMFLHWGLYSQLGKGEWAKLNYGIPNDEYAKLAETFTADRFDGRAIARAARQTGMRYATLTSRHHDGFSLYDTRGLSAFDVTNSAAKRDLVLDFCEGCRAEGVVPMLYCTTLDWTDARFGSDFDAYLEYLRDSVELLCTQYGDIGGFWFDGNWSKPDADWKETELYGVIRKHQPEAMIINNVGIGNEGAIGHPEIDATTFEQSEPEPLDRRGWPKHVAGEMCRTFNRHWGIGAKDFNMYSPAHVIELLCACRGAGANLLMNIGPEASGALPDYEKAALAKVGEWVRLHGGNECTIYDGKPTGVRGQGRDFGLTVGAQADDEVIDLFVHSITPTANRWPEEGPRGAGARMFKGVPERYTSARWLDNDERLKIERHDDGSVTLHATGFPYGVDTVVRVARLEA
ncbi:MAG: alpha-L-fucosidase [Phycisphaera sp.]|nr:MAG: alpha-L-fucosidase [Phycisphaera sp.]